MTCQACGFSVCLAWGSDTLPTLDIHTEPASDDCGIPKQGTRTQLICIDSTKNHPVDIQIQADCRQQAVSVLPPKTDIFPIPNNSPGNEYGIELERNNVSRPPSQVVLDIKLSIDRGEGRPNQELTSFSVKRTLV